MNAGQTCDADVDAARKMLDTVTRGIDKLNSPENSEGQSSTPQ